MRRIPRHAGLIGKGPDGKPTTWGDIDNKFFTAKSDDRVYIIGDSIGQVSPLFGHYPKSAHVASTLGRSVAKNLSQRVAGKTVERGLVIVHTGTGKGKTTAALGLMLRMLGRGRRVACVMARRKGVSAVTRASKAPNGWGCTA